MSKTNGVMMQYFHWYLPSDASLWKKVKEQASSLADLGISALWLPPSYKALSGAKSVGYDVYDLYDLGEFNQKGTIATKYGTKDEYLQAVETARKFGIDVYADIVINHKAGADFRERVWAQKVDWKNRELELGEPKIIEAWTKFYFPGRIKYDNKRNIIDYKYSNFLWDYLYFDGVDWNHKEQEKAIFKFKGDGNSWEKMLSNEKGNYDYLMFADIDFEMKEVREELKQWVKWYVEFTGVAGFRLDAIKHITLGYFNEWLDYIRKETGKELFTVGEYWAPFDLDILERYLIGSDFRMSLFDAPLQNKFHHASKQGSSFDLQKLFDNTLLSKHPVYSVTLVDNHDTQPLQALEAPVEDWFKPLAYAIILLRKDGYPCVFYPDLYGAEYTDKGRDGNDYKITLSPVKELSQLLKIRQKYAWGKQINYFDYPSTFGWTRLGDENHSNALAVVISNSNEGFKKMYVGKKFAGKQFIDSLANRSEKITVNVDGTADFTVNSRSVSVWTNI